MPDIRIDLRPRIDEQDIVRLRKNLKDLAPGDQITIRMEAADAHQSDGITGELERQGFDYQPHGGHGKDFFLLQGRKPEIKKRSYWPLFYQKFLQQIAVISYDNMLDGSFRRYAIAGL